MALQCHPLPLVSRARWPAFLTLLIPAGATLHFQAAHDLIVRPLQYRIFGHFSGTPNHVTDEFARSRMRPWRNRLLFRHPEAAAARYDRTARSTWRRYLSIRSGGWHPSPPRCRRGSIHRRGCCPSTTDRSGATDPPLRYNKNSRPTPSAGSVARRPERMAA